MARDKDFEYFISMADLRRETRIALLYELNAHVGMGGDKLLSAIYDVEDAGLSALKICVTEDLWKVLRS